MNGYILAHDLGTSGDKATLYDWNGKLCSSVLYEYPTFYPQEGRGRVEQNSEDWWKGVCTSTHQLISKSGIAPEGIECITFSGQMMGCLPVNRKGETLRSSIIWADMRSEDQAGTMTNLLGMEACYRITGHRIGSSYSAAKILWIKENEPEIFKKTYKFLQAKDFIALKLTGKFVTDYSDASGTNLLDIEKKVWSQDILSALKIDENMLPELHRSTDMIGRVTCEAAREVGLLEGTPVIIGGGDGSCAAVGAGAVEEGITYNVIGTSSWIACATRKPYLDKQMRTFNWVHLDPDYYTPCGTMQAAGYSMSWLKNTLCGLETAQAKEQKRSAYAIIDEEILSSAPGAGKLIYLPYLLGERSPRWNANARGAFIGLTMASTKAEIYRAVLEGVGYNLKVILDALSESVPIEAVHVIGGGAKSAVWLQILADIWQKPLLIPEYLEEATSMGAAVCGGVGVGMFKDFKVINQFNKVKKQILPRPENASVYQKLFSVFEESYNALVPVYEKLKLI